MRFTDIDKLLIAKTNEEKSTSFDLSQFNFIDDDRAMDGVIKQSLEILPSFSVSLSGQYLASCSENAIPFSEKTQVTEQNLVRLLDLNARKSLLDEQEGSQLIPSSIENVHPLSDGNIFMSSTNGELHYFDRQQNKMIDWWGHKLPTIKATSVSLLEHRTGSKSYLVSASVVESSEIKIWEVSEGRVIYIALYSNHNMDYFTGRLIALSDGRLLSTHLNSIRVWPDPNSIKMWENRTGSVNGNHTALPGSSHLSMDAIRYSNSHATQIAASPDSKRIWIGYFDGTIEVRNATTLECEAKWSAHTEHLTGLVVLMDNETGMSASRDGTIKFWREGRCICIWLNPENNKPGPFSSHIYSLNLLPNGDVLTTSATGQDKNVYHWQAPVRELVFADIKELLERLKELPQVTTLVMPTMQLKDEDLKPFFSCVKANPQIKKVDLSHVLMTNTICRKIKSALDQILVFKVQKDYEINHQELSNKKPIGKGGFGQVFAAIWNSRAVAVKELNAAQLKADELKKEMQIMFKLDSPYIVAFLGYYTAPQFGIVMEFMAQGSLFSILHDSKRDLSWDWRYNVVSQVAKGVEYLHAQDIIHGDLKAANVLVDVSGNAKIADFGLAERKIKSAINNGMRTISAPKLGGTIKWMAPEIFCGGITTKRTDIYALGLVFWEILERKVPFENLSESQVIFNVAKSGVRPPISPFKDPKAQKIAKLIPKLWMADLLRPNASEIVAELENDSSELVPTKNSTK